MYFRTFRSSLLMQIYLLIEREICTWPYPQNYCNSLGLNASQMLHPLHKVNISIHVR